jgi:hypothetical protein
MKYNDINYFILLRKMKHNLHFLQQAKFTHFTKQYETKPTFFTAYIKYFILLRKMNKNLHFITANISSFISWRIMKHNLLSYTDINFSFYEAKWSTFYNFYSTLQHQINHKITTETSWFILLRKIKHNLHFKT